MKYHPAENDDILQKFLEPLQIEKLLAVALHGWYVEWRRGSDQPQEAFYSDVSKAGEIAKALSLWDGQPYVPPWRK